MTNKEFKAWRYIAAVRNPDNREYAIRYLDELKGRARCDCHAQNLIAERVIRKCLHSIWFGP